MDEPLMRPLLTLGHNLNDPFRELLDDVTYQISKFYALWILTIINKTNFLM